MVNGPSLVMPTLCRYLIRADVLISLDMVDDNRNGALSIQLKAWKTPKEILSKESQRQHQTFPTPSSSLDSFSRLRNWNCKCELSTSFCLLLSRCYPWNWHNEIPSGCSASKNMSVNWIWAKNFNRQIEKKNGTEELCECNQPSDSAKFRAKSELPHLLGMFFWKSSA